MTDEDHNPPKSVVDEEGTVEQKVKTRIINARERVDEREDELFVQAPIDPNAATVDRRRLLVAWGTSVRQFVRTIRPLLLAEDVEGAKRYWEDIDIGEPIEVPPPDGKKEWSMFAMDRDESAVRQHLGISDAVEPPEAERVVYQGLQDVLQREEISVSWDICLNPQAPPPKREWDRLSVNYPTPKSVLQAAIERADEFLQSVGIGLEMDTKGTDIIRNFDQSGEEPEAEYGIGEYDANPDI